MNMDVGYDLQMMRPAVRPELAEVAPVEAHDARVQAVGVEIVVENVVDDPLRIAFQTTEKERPAFSRAILTAETQIPTETMPQPP
jgi:hypothetical protein